MNTNVACVSFSAPNHPIVENSCSDMPVRKSAGEARNHLRVRSRARRVPSCVLLPASACLGRGFFVERPRLRNVTVKVLKRREKRCAVPLTLTSTRRQVKSAQQKEDRRKQGICDQLSKRKKRSRGTASCKKKRQCLNPKVEIHKLVGDTDVANSSCSETKKRREGTNSRLTSSHRSRS